MSGRAASRTRATTTAAPTPGAATARPAPSRARAPSTCRSTATPRAPATPSRSSSSERRGRPAPGARARPARPPGRSAGIVAVVLHDVDEFRRLFRVPLPVSAHAAYYVETLARSPEYADLPARVDRFAAFEARL